MKYISLVFVLLITACSNVPVSTMLHFSDAKPEDFFQVDPNGIRVKVTINSESTFDPVVSVGLSATIQDENGERKFTFPLEQICMHKLAAETGYFSDKPAFDVFILKLSAQAIKSLAVINKERMSGNKKRVGLSAGVNFSKTSNVINEDTVLSIGLKLSENDKFVMLIDNWRVQEVK